MIKNTILIITMFCVQSYAVSTVVSINKNTLVKINEELKCDTIYISAKGIENVRSLPKLNVVYFLTNKGENEHMLLVANLGTKKIREMFNGKVIDYAVNEEGSVIIAYHDKDQIVIKSVGKNIVYKKYPSKTILWDMSLKGNSLFYYSSEGLNQEKNLNYLNISTLEGRIYQKDRFPTYKLIDQDRFVSFFGNEGFPSQLAFSIIPSDSFYIGFDMERDRLILWGTNILFNKNNRIEYYVLALKDKIPLMANSDEYFMSMNPPFTRCIYRINAETSKKDKIYCGALERLCDIRNDHILLLSENIDSERSGVFDVELLNIKESKSKVILKKVSIDPLDDIAIFK